LQNKMNDWAATSTGPVSEADRRIAAEYKTQFLGALSDDLDMPIALSALWTCLRDDRLSDAAKYGFFRSTDSVLGLTKKAVDELTLSFEQQKLIKEREAARASRDWERADELRATLKAQGIVLKDRPTGTDWYVKKL
jgi:cysteinyl-tRNA synthetase